MEKIRLNKYLASLGVAARRKIDQMIEAGRISVNGQVVKELGMKINPQADQVLVDNRPVKLVPELEYYIVNKPKGVISTAQDTHGRKTVVDLAPAKARLYPVGRLDQETEGLIILTNDGELTNKLTHPKFHIPKTYSALILGKVKESKLDEFRRGIMLDSKMTSPAQVKVLDQSSSQTLIEIVLHEGRNQQIRRMCAYLHLHLLNLKRVAIGPIQLRDLPPGQYRPLSQEEVSKLIS